MIAGAPARYVMQRGSSFRAPGARKNKKVPEADNFDSRDDNSNKYYRGTTLLTAI